VVGGEKDLPVGKGAASLVDGQRASQGVAREDGAEGRAVDGEDATARAHHVAGHGGDGLDEKAAVRQVAAVVDERTDARRDAEGYELAFAGALLRASEVEPERQARGSVPDKVRRPEAPKCSGGRADRKKAQRGLTRTRAA